MKKAKRCFSLIICIGALFLALLLIGVYNIYVHNAYISQFKPTGNDIGTVLTRGFHDYIVNFEVALTAHNLNQLSEIDDYYIFIDDKDYALLVSDLPDSGKNNEVNGYLKFNNEKMQPVELRFRGDNGWHWLYNQKSWRIKTEKDEAVLGQRKINLINARDKSLLSYYVPAKISEHMNILTADVEHVRVFINNKYSGVHINVDQTDEYFLRNNGKLPSDLYTGDTSGRDGSVYNLENLKLWEKMAEYNVFESDDFTMMGKLLSIINLNNNETFSSEIESILDVDKFIKYQSLERLANSTHSDNHHNNKFYFDPSSGKFEPVTWDLFGYAIRSFHDIMFPRDNLDLQFLRNPIYVEQMNEEIFYQLENGLEEYILNEIDNTYEKIKEDVYADTQKDYVYFEPSAFNDSRPYTNAEFDESIQEKKDFISGYLLFLRRELNDTQLFYQFDETNDDYYVKFASVGDASSTINHIEFEGVTENDTVSIYRDMNFNGVVDDFDTIIVNSGLVNNTVELNEKIYAGYNAVERNGDNLPNTNVELVDGLMNYNYIIQFQNSDSNDVSIKNIDVENSITGTYIYPIKREIADVQDTIYSVHPWKTLKEKHVKNLVFEAGDHIINDDIIINKDSSLTLKPGARLLMKEDVSIFVYGKLEVDGTEDKPVIITAYDKEKPFGVFALQGYYNPEYTHIVDNLIIEHGGIEDSFDNVIYSGMFSAYNTNLILQNSVIKDDTGGDDAFNAKQSHVEISRSQFVNSFSDALDIDICTGFIENCYFNNIGNDAIDMMTCEVTLKNNYYTNANDKAISVGERSNPLIVNNYIKNCEIGIQIKDDSNPLILNNAIVNCTEGVYGYRKNQRYNVGGRGLLINTFVFNSEKNDINIFKDSTLDIRNSAFGSISEEKENSITQTNNYSSIELFDTNYYENDYVAQPKDGILYDGGDLDFILNNTEYNLDHAPIGLLEKIDRWWD